MDCPMSSTFSKEGNALAHVALRNPGGVRWDQFLLTCTLRLESRCRVVSKVFQSDTTKSQSTLGGGSSMFDEWGQTVMEDMPS